MHSNAYSNEKNRAGNNSTLRHYVNEVRGLKSVHIPSVMNNSDICSCCVIIYLVI